MNRVNRIIRHPLWQGAMAQIEAMEETRIYCKHDLTHLLDTARLAHIENLEESLGVSKELIYAAALLHDIGRGLEYVQDVPHHEASCALAGTILSEIGFCEEECAAIIEAIGAHRQPDSRLRSDLAGLLYRADKGSRNCFYCKQQGTCNWSEDKKNKEIKD
ncbi:HD domain-containing protein [Emergencia sp. 1XD21-10]|nr:HD domain-containing protein [Emergencia sp. 1XD21-10]